MTCLVYFFTGCFVDKQNVWQTFYWVLVSISNVICLMASNDIQFPFHKLFSKDAFYTWFEYLTFNSATELSVKPHWLSIFNIGQTLFIVSLIFCNGEFLTQSCARIHWRGILGVDSSSVRYLIVLLRNVNYHGTLKCLKALLNWDLRFSEFHKAQVLVAFSHCWLLPLVLIDHYLWKKWGYSFSTALFFKLVFWSKWLLL